jgi:hypothetical protein
MKNVTKDLPISGFCARPEYYTIAYMSLNIEPYITKSGV